MTAPAGYEWLSSIGTLPRTIAEGLRLFGVAERVGRGSNPVITGWRDELNAAGIVIAGYSDDDIPWCGLFVAIVCHRAGKPVVASPLWARNWRNFGLPMAHGAALGDVLVFERGSGGHVGFYIGEDASAYHVLGGNQGNRVSIARLEKARCIGVRRPPYRVPPDSVTPRHLSARGVLSRDEA